VVLHDLEVRGERDYREKFLGLLSLSPSLFLSLQLTMMMKKLVSID
jgi:hypothetical protein